MGSTCGQRDRSTLYAKMNQNTEKGGLHKEDSFHEFPTDIVVGSMLRGIEHKSITVFWSGGIVNSHCAHKFSRKKIITGYVPTKKQP